MIDLTRSDWGADAPAFPVPTRPLGDRPGVELHHTVGTYGASRPEAMLRAMDADHRDRLGSPTVWYGLVVWPDGTIVEGRGLDALSGEIPHVTIALAGDYDRRQVPEEMAEAVARLVDALRREGVGDEVVWHALRGGSECPGAYGIELAERLRDGDLDAGEPRDLGDRVLRLRDPMMRGRDVEDLQERLNEWLAASGVDLDDLDVDGVFGPLTAEAASAFMDVEMGVRTDDPRVGPRTAAKLDRVGDRIAEGRYGDPDYVVAIVADGDIDEGIALTLSQQNSWRFLRWPAEVEDVTIGTAVLVGRVARVDDGPWSDRRDVIGSDRFETAALAAERIEAGPYGSRDTWGG